jgi:hypothetical protein
VAASAAEVSELIRLLLRPGTEDAMWSAMLREDPNYAKIPAEQRGEAVRRAATSGRGAADEIRSQTGTADAARICDRAGVRVVVSAEPYVHGKIVQTSTYVHRQRIITIYQGSVDEMNRFLREQALGDILGIADVSPVYLTHELFHHLEESGRGRAADLLQVVTFAWGPVVRRSGIARMSEIAADAFAQRLLDLPFAPRLLDYLTVWIHDEAEGRRRLQALAEL